MTTPLEILLRARSLLAAGWTQSVGARDKDGQDISCWRLDAICFCSIAAISRAVQESIPYHAALSGQEIHTRSTLLDKAVMAIIPSAANGAVARRQLVTINDTHDQTQEGVLALFDAGIVRLNT